MQKPLATLLRPKTLADFFGQKHLLGENKPLAKVFEYKNLHSMILWGPPGTGKTTLAHLLAKTSEADFICLSAVMSGVKEIRAVQEKAEHSKKNNIKTVLFIDEVHRFNKTQQDAFLPLIEDGTFLFIGATTENPSFEINSALLSRCRTYILYRLTTDEIIQIIDRALNLQQFNENNEFIKIHLNEDQKIWLAHASDGDARQTLNMLEMLFQNIKFKKGEVFIQDEELKAAITGQLRQFDKKGDQFYEQISALHKSVRGSNPDATLYWLARMLDGGADMNYIARRMVRMASEDIGNADPRALSICLDAWGALERLGQPEGELALAQALAYLAVAPKSNAIYTAFNAAKEDVKNYGSLPVPIHLRNAPTKFMKALKYGQSYRYDHDEDNAFAKGQTYFPETIGEKIYYKPTARGLEIKIKEKLDKLRELNSLEETMN